MDLRDALPRHKGPFPGPGLPLPHLLHGRHSEPAGQMEPEERGPKTDGDRCAEAGAWANPRGGRWREGEEGGGG